MLLCNCCRPWPYTCAGGEVCPGRCGTQPAAWVGCWVRGSNSALTGLKCGAHPEVEGVTVLRVEMRFQRRIYKLVLFRGALLSSRDSVFVFPGGGETFRFVCKYRKEKRGANVSSFRAFPRATARESGIAVRNRLKT